MFVTAASDNKELPFSVTKCASPRMRRKDGRPERELGLAVGSSDEPL
ncbi:MAG TPA: hypothetical protein VFY54_03235 [Rubrobacter sp.]|nr:hypothetical protein [Rubrobacter sp.]